MDKDEETILTGGNMSDPVYVSGTVVKNATVASETIHRLLHHVRNHGVDWVPESISVKNGKHTLRFIEGEVFHHPEQWLWDLEILIDIAGKLRQWHDATEAFSYSHAKWLLANSHPLEVICHNDIAPYNTVFKDHKIAGIIDFDVCSPGSRLWDISYAAYRFVPLIPEDARDLADVFSLFKKDVVRNRIRLFLREYGAPNSSIQYSIGDLINTAKARLGALANWTVGFASEHGKDELFAHAETYRRHVAYLEALL